MVEAGGGSVAPESMALASVVESGGWGSLVRQRDVGCDSIMRAKIKENMFFLI
jgi:hypothetical protein